MTDKRSGLLSTARRLVVFLGLIGMVLGMTATDAPAAGCVPGTGQPLCGGVDTDCDNVVDQCDTLELLPSIGRSGVGLGEVLGPWGMALDSAGHLYVAEVGTHRVEVFDQNGVFLRQIGSFGSGSGG